MAPRPRIATDAQILDATARAIGRVGPAKLSLADVAAEVGLSPSTLVQRFGSKRTLLLALIDRSGDGLRQEFAREKQKHDSPLNALMAVSLAQTRYFRTPEELSNHLAFLQMDLNDSEFRSRAVENVRWVQQELKKMLDEAVAAGELNRCDTAGLAEAIHAAFNGTLVFWAMHRRGSARERVRKVLDTLIQPYRREVHPEG